MGCGDDHDDRERIERVFREESGRILATLIRVLGDFELAEDAKQDAFVAALEHWARDGIPENPGAWIQTVARRNAIDRLRRRRFEAPTETLPEQYDDEEIAELEAALDRPIDDDQLRLIFTCCHPSLEREAQVALTLSTVGGLTTDEIARAFLVSRTTLQQRLVRSKKKIRLAGIPFRVPPRELLAERTPAVLLVLYLIFNEGYSASAGQSLTRRELCDDAIRLARLLAALLPSEPEVHGLLALMLFQHSRRDARTDRDGLPILLSDQDRTIWDRASIDEANRILERGRRFPRIGVYGLQAEIAAQHSHAATADRTDWRAIEQLYRRLVDLHPTAIVALNHAVAVMMAEGPERALELMVDLADPLDGYLYLHSTMAEALSRLGRTAEAGSCYRRALTLAETEPERKFLTKRLGELGIE
ncbi:MAG: RNA polymerase sigma factor [Planctomycetes bacterium]|nr:RNA polymerase sigma factor [Planctomycetota bacterium]